MMLARNSPAALPGAPASLSAAAALRTFLRGLAVAARRVAAGTWSETSIDALDLAAAALWDSEYGVADRPPQVAILGPTQTGKSTIVNLLAGQTVAEVSPLAGFTVHPHGFVLGTAEEAGWSANLFQDRPRCTREVLSRDELDKYTLATVPTGTGSDNLPPCVLWDTPDFDSLAARRYARGVLEVAAIADVYVLVLSKEKYSDLSAWRMLELLAPLARPLVIVLNKLTPDAEAVVVASLRARLAERGREWGDVPIVPLPYVSALGENDWASQTALAAPVRAAVREALVRAPVARRAGVVALVQRHWDEWLTPVRAEHAALERWNLAVDGAAARLMAAYARDYLDHPQRWDAFRRAAVELLALLEIPRIAGVMARARQAATWPARQLLAAGQSWWAQRRWPVRRTHSLGVEATVLSDAVEAALTELERDVLRQAVSGAVWRALEARLSTDSSRRKQVYDDAIVAHHERMTCEVRATAGRLYGELQQRPGRLAALRTGRAAIDFGSLLLAVKTAGLTPWDAVFAPAAFAAASLLMEGIAGVEFAHEARRLKEQQRAALERDFVQAVFVAELRKLACDLTGDGVCGAPPEALARAEQARCELERAA